MTLAPASGDSTRFVSFVIVAVPITGAVAGSMLLETAGLGEVADEATLGDWAGDGLVGWLARDGVAEGLGLLPGTAELRRSTPVATAAARAPPMRTTTAITPTTHLTFLRGVPPAGFLNGISTVGSGSVNDLVSGVPEDGSKTA